MGVKVLETTLQEGWYYDAGTGQWYYYDEEGRRYIYVAGYIYPAVQWQAAPKLVNVKHGDTLRITVSFTYSGLAKTLKLRGSIGNLGSGWPYSFDEVVYAWSPAFTLPDSPSPTVYTRQVDIPILVKPNVGGQLEGGLSYSIYAKLEDGVSFVEGETGSVALRDAVFVVAAEPTFSDFAITDYLVP